MASKSGRPVRVVKKVIRQGQLKRSADAEARAFETQDEIVKSLNPAITRNILLIDPREGELGAKASVVCVVDARDMAVGMLGWAQPVPLQRLKLDNGTLIRPVDFEPKSTLTARVKSREPIAPFIFTVTQGLNYGPHVRLTWVTKIGGQNVSIVAEIQRDPAHFDLVERGVTGRDYRVKWVRSRFPNGQSGGLWNKWYGSQKELETAFCRVWWPVGGYPEQYVHDPLGAAIYLLLSTMGGESDGSD